MQYTIKSGDTLSAIAKQYKLDWRDLWKANPNIKDPNLIHSGDVLTIPESSSESGGSLEKTLDQPATEEKTLPDNTDGATVETNTLPTTNLDQMSLLKMALKTASKSALSAGLKTGMSTVLGGVDSTKVSGSMMEKISNFVSGNVKSPIQDEFDKMTETVNSIIKQKSDLETQQNKVKDDARQQISLAISSEMWNRMTDAQRKELWIAAGYSGDPVTSQNTAAYHVTDENGDVWNVTYDKSTGSIIKKENLGAIGNSSGSGGVTLQQATKQMSAKLASVAGEDGYVHQSDYAAAKQAWVTETGYTAKQFDEAMSIYRNPQNNQYKIEI